MTWSLRIVACLVVLALAACDRYPRDPQDTLARAQGQALHIGIAPDPPFVVLAPGRLPRGAEITLIDAWAEALDARVLWVEGAHEGLMADLEAFRLLAVVGGLTPGSGNVRGGNRRDR